MLSLSEVPFDVLLIAHDAPRTLMRVLSAWRLRVEFSAYQYAAVETNLLRLGGPQGAIAAMLGLAARPARY